MKFAVLVLASAFAGVLAVAALPLGSLRAGIFSVTDPAKTLGLDQMHFTFADLNPLRVIFDWEQMRIRTGNTPDQLGFHGSAVKLGPMWTPPAQPAFGAPQYQTSQASDPMGWNGSPPH